MDQTELQRYHIHCALVTGACSGIGLSFVRRLAAEGIEVMMVSNNARRLSDAAEQIRSESSATVHTFCADLALENAAQTVYDYCCEQGVVVDLLVNNAGIFFFRDVMELSPVKLQAMINLHVTALTQMARLFGAAMSQSRRGYILNIASMAAWMPYQGLAVYSATKSYVVNLSLALHDELRGEGVHLTVVCPGGVDTDLYGLNPELRRLGVKLGVLMLPEELVSRSLAALFAGQRKLVPGLLNRLFIAIAPIVPRRAIRIARQKLRRYE